MQAEIKKLSTKERQEPVFDIIIEMLLIAFMFLTPVIFDRRIGIVFSITKVTVMRLLMTTMIAVWMIKLMLKQNHKFVRTPLDFPVLSYMLAATVAAITSVHPFMSFIGFYGRYEGLSTLYIYGLLYFVTTNFIKTKEQILRLMWTTMIAAAFMSMYGVIQRFGLDPYAWGGVVTWQRVIGTIGQPNFLAAYVDMAFIIGLALLLRMGDIDWAGWRTWGFACDAILRGSLLAGLFLIYVCVLFTISRGGFLGLFGGMAVFFALAKRDLAIRKWREMLTLFVMIVVVTGITSLNPETSPFGRVTSEVAKVEELAKLETSIITYSASLSRIETWKSGFKIIADHPLFGIGEEVLKMVFPRYETNKFRFYEGFHVKQDRCHNEVCDMSVTRGTITLALYVWLIATYFYMSVKIIRGDADPELRLFTAAFLGASIAYIMQNEFSFGVVAITTLFWNLMGLTCSIYVKPPQNEARTVDISEMPWLSFALVVIMSLVIGFYSTVQFRADMYFKNGRNLADMRRYDEAARAFEGSLRILPYEGGTWTHYSITLLNIGQMAGSRQIIEKAIESFGVGTKLDPYNADNFYIMGRAQYLLSLSDASYVPRIVEAEKNAISIDPYYAEAFQMLGIMSERAGRLEEAARMYERSLEINPQMGDSVASLASVSFRMGQSNRLVDIFKKFLEKYPNNPVYKENLAAAYVRRNEIDKAIKVYEEMIVTDPKSVIAYVNLGFMSARVGNIRKAKESFESAILIDPKRVDAHNGLGLVYLTVGQKERAREEFLTSLMLDPNNQYAKQMLGEIK